MTESRRICLIDDDIYVRDTLAVGLREAGYEVAVAPGAMAGLDLVAHHGADAIITDIKMPGTDGAELIAQARAAWPLITIIAISGAGAIDGRNVSDLVRERGANGVLIKPFRAQELAALVDRLLEEKKSGDRP